MKYKGKLLSVPARWAVRCGFCLICLMLVRTAYSAYICRQNENLLKEFDVIVTSVKNGTLKPDKSGDIVLPPRWTRLTKNGHVYVTSAADGPLARLFPMEVDGGGELVAGYVYCEFPLPAEDKWGHRWLTFSKMQGVMILYPLDVARQFSKVHPHWYYAEPFYS
jgi:hypothetical protein